MSVDQARKESAVFQVNCVINCIGRREVSQMTFIIAAKRRVASKSAIVVDLLGQPNGSISITQDLIISGLGRGHAPALTRATTHPIRNPLQFLFSKVLHPNSFIALDNFSESSGHHHS